MDYKRAFTLVELLLAMAIMMILAGILLYAVRGSSGHAKESSSRAKLAIITQALETFKRDYGYYPPQTTAASFNPKQLKMYKSTRSNGPFSGASMIPGYAGGDFLDAWGIAIRYQCPGSHNTSAYDLCIAGQDELFDTADDITNWK